MQDDVLINKTAIIERCLIRIREEYTATDDFAHNYTHQDAAILNIQRACEAALDMGQHLIFRERLGVPQSARDVFTILAQTGWIDETLATNLKNMVGFRNIAVHEYQTLQLPVIEYIINERLNDFLQYTAAILQKDQ